MPEPLDVVIKHGDDVAAVSVIGGALRSYRSGEREVLDVFPPGTPPAGARGAVLAPWPNRLRDGHYRWDGVDHQLPINEADRRTALHGLVLDRHWIVADHLPAAVTLTVAVGPESGYPFALTLSVRYALDADGLSVTTAAINVGVDAAPFGLGHHPYLAAARTDRIDECTLVVPAARYLPPDDRGIPGRLGDVSGDVDLRTPRLLGPAVIDATFTELLRDDVGRFAVSLTGPHGDATVLTLDEAYRYVHVYTGDTLPEPQRRRSVAVEPMTCPANALQSGDDVIRLDPGATTAARWWLRASGA